jgi:uncharacterized protein (DUF1697 family)
MTYLALLRGINVGGHHKVEMARLRRAFEGLGFEKVRTFIQSGNVVFNAAKSSNAALCRRIEEKLTKEFGFPIPIVVRTGDEIAKILNSNPFLRRKGINVSKLHVTFLIDAPTADDLKKVASLAGPLEEFRCVGKELYLHLPNGMGNTKLGPTAFNRSLSASATTRNWNTVTKLCALVEQ